MRLLMYAVAAFAAAPAAAATDADAAIASITAGQPYRAAVAALDSGHDKWVADIVAITQIPSPPFKEQARARAFADMLRQRGLDPKIDAEGNVLALRKGTTPGPVVVVSAHLDTVFPEGTDVTVRREGTKLRAPGVPLGRACPHAESACTRSLIGACARPRVPTAAQRNQVSPIPERRPAPAFGAEPADTSLSSAARKRRTHLRFAESHRA